MLPIVAGGLLLYVLLSRGEEEPVVPAPAPPPLPKKPQPVSPRRYPRKALFVELPVVTPIAWDRHDIRQLFPSRRRY